MKCTEVENNLIFFIEGNLPEDKMTDIQNHLDNCNNCNSLHQKIKKELLFIEHDKITENNPFFYQRLAEQLQKEENSKTSVISLKTKQFYIQVAAYAAGIIIAILLGIGLGADFNNSNDLVLENTEELTEYQMFADSYNLNQPDEYTYELEIAENK